MRHGHLRQSRQGRPAPGAPEGTLTTRRLQVVRTYLALDDRSQYRPPAAAPLGARVVRRTPCPVPEYRRLYRDVGGEWYWHDRLEWSDDALRAHLASPRVGVWELLVDEASAGYFELQHHDDGSVEIVYFGLMRAHIGRGLGGFLLGRAVEEAWAMAGDSRIWLHTCTLDSERALPSYRARGFRPFRTERLEVELEGSSVVSERLLPD